ncbi:hypothetical protein [Salsuginibacillus kocurii]|uniref:hypothetical protein n=1 Tax=Salsuginibacillus kocurii TaxID=427078 RepID=UPI00036A4B1E|nr:hypothetical protein [Salsuginibacillus kocurii]
MGDKNTGNTNIYEVLKTFPMNYPINKVVIEEQEEDVTNFLTFDEENGVAIFKNGAETKVVEYWKITGFDMN